MAKVEERYYSLAEIGRYLPAPRSYWTLRRWADFGVKTKTGKTVKLRTILIGNVLHTRVSDFQKFMRATNPDTEFDE